MAIHYDTDDDGALEVLRAASDDCSLLLHLEEIAGGEWWLQVTYGTKTFDIHLTSKRAIEGVVSVRGIV